MKKLIEKAQDLDHRSGRTSKKVVHTLRTETTSRICDLFAELNGCYDGIALNEPA